MIQFRLENTRNKEVDSVKTWKCKTVYVTPFQILSILYWIIFSLSLISLILSFIKYVTPPETTNHINILMSFFYLDRESNIPTYFASTILLVAATLLAYIFLLKKLRRDKYRFYWALLSFTFLVLSIDEYMSFHELLTEPVQEEVQLPSFFYYAWVIPGMILLAATGLLFLKFILHLNRHTRKQFLVAALLFVGGALGCELLSGTITVHYGKETFLYAAASHLEEILEMVGISYFIYSLLSYINLMTPGPMKVIYSNINE